MSVKWRQTIVMTMPPVLTLLGVSTVLVTMDMMEMESTAQVIFFFFLPACHVRSARPTGPKITLCFQRLLVYLCVCTYHVHNKYVTYIVAMRPCSSRLQQFRRLL